MERRHLVERTAGKFEADISRDRDVGVAAVDQCAGRWCGADNLDFPRFETDDATTTTRCPAGASNDAEGHRPVVIFATADDDVAEVDGLIGPRVDRSRYAHRSPGGGIGELALGGVVVEAGGTEDETERRTHAAGHHGEAFKLERDVIRVMDDDDGINRHSELIGLADGGVDRREADDRRREDWAGRPRLRREHLRGVERGVAQRQRQAVGGGTFAGG